MAKRKRKRTEPDLRAIPGSKPYVALIDEAFAKIGLDDCWFTTSPWFSKTSPVAAKRGGLSAPEVAEGVELVIAARAVIVDVAWALGGADAEAALYLLGAIEGVGVKGARLQDRCAVLARHRGVAYRTVRETILRRVKRRMVYELYRRVTRTDDLMAS